MSNDTGKWLPMAFDGSFHSCNQNQSQTVTKQVKDKSLTVEQRLLRLERIVLDHVANGEKELSEIKLGRGFGGITDIKTGPVGLLYILTFDE